MMRNRMLRMMYGRNGLDDLSRFISYAACVFLIAAIFIPGLVGLLLWLLALAGLGVAYYRIFSRNLYKRRAENARFLRLRYRLVREWRSRWQRLKLRKNYRIFTCPQCQALIRIPRGHGQIVVTCPRCRTAFNGRS